MVTNSFQKAKFKRAFVNSSIIDVIWGFYCIKRLPEVGDCYKLHIQGHFLYRAVRAAREGYGGEATGGETSTLCSMRFFAFYLC